MKMLIVEDDFTSRLLLQELLKPFGDVHVAVNGPEAIEAFRGALAGGEAYDLICLDIMMPGMDGHEVLTTIRGIEDTQHLAPGKQSKIFMTTALDSVRDVIQAFSGLCDAYLVKPIEKAKLLAKLREMGLFPADQIRA